ncbi:heavy metal-binding domain-containing protein [Spirillospora sp. NPDC047279]|uniref:YbjQ family protein n=1 Tax=Spirillospora sp. NPDC047279 TaxID=3155478 RepID=UPI0033FD8C8D
MLIVTTDGLAGYEIRNVLGEVLGVAVQTDQATPGGPQSSATFRVTGEQQGVGLAAARREAVDRLAQEAHRKGANAVVGMCFDTAQLSGGHEVCAYGTAVWAEPAKAAAAQPQPGQMPQQAPAAPPYGDHPQHGGAPMAARNLTIGLHDRPR